MMIDAAFMFVIVGAVVIAFGVDVAALVGWLRWRWRSEQRRLT